MPNGTLQSSGILSFAESLGEVFGKAIARGINAGLGGATGGPSAAAPSTAPRRRGRPPKAAAGGNRCQEPGCNNPARSKGLCSKHYQAARRKALKR